MVEKRFDSYKRTLNIENKVYSYYDIKSYVEDEGYSYAQLPYSIRILLEGMVRQYDGVGVTKTHIEKTAGWAQGRGSKEEIPFIPSRIILQDFTGVPAVVDLAAMRESLYEAGLDPKKINPLVPVDLVIDHSLMVDAFGKEEALGINTEKEFERNDERYRFLRWASKTFDNFRVVPPATGIIHQVNLEYLASVAMTKVIGDETYIYPDTLVGTDSHTTMINGLGVLGWGVGGIEAEAGMLGQPLYFITPEVVGVRLIGALAEGATATDLALTVTQKLRAYGVVGKFVEYFGEGIETMSLADRGTLANMSPEYGATMGYFPVDDETIDYLINTGRSKAHAQLVKAYYKEVGLYREDPTETPAYSSVIEIDMSSVVPSLAGPKRPQDKVDLNQMKNEFIDVATKPIVEGGFGNDLDQLNKEIPLEGAYKGHCLKTGSVVLAAITSCTNTSNPSVMIGAALVAKKAVERGLKTSAFVKTSLTPGSQVVTQYLKDAGLLHYLEQLGFNVVGYGCATCIGNSGPLPEEVATAIEENDMTVASVLSGNRNFEGRIHSQIKANYLASPMLVVAYALAGNIIKDFESEPVGLDANGHEVYLRDIWPSSKEIKEAVYKAVKPSMFRQCYERIFDANKQFNEIPVFESERYHWSESSTYIKEPPFFQGLSKQAKDIEDIKSAKVLALLGDSVTTDHISPAGVIGKKSPAGLYLEEHGIDSKSFNSYGSRRGNHEVMMRGTFGNIRIRNKIAPGTEGGYTTNMLTDEVMSIYEASQRYIEEGVNLVVIAGKEYGTGSSRDWAAKGTNLLGVKAVIAESFERIHRSNLVGMGVLPLQFLEGEDAKTLGLTGYESYEISGLSNEIKPRDLVDVIVTSKEGQVKAFKAVLRLDGEVDKTYYRNGGILHTVIRDMMNE